MLVSGVEHNDSVIQACSFPLCYYKILNIVPCPCMLTQLCLTLRATWQTVVHRAPLSMGFSRQECCSGLPFPTKIVCCAMQWILFVYLFYLSWCVSVHPQTPDSCFSPLLTVNLFSMSVSPFLFCKLFVSFFKILHISDIICYSSFSAWLTSLNMVIFRSIHVVADDTISFFFMTK